MARKSARPRRRGRQANSKAYILISIVVVAVIAVSFLLYRAMSRHVALDEVTLCPPDPRSITVLLVDVTDPMTVAQQQDFRNQLERLRNSIPRYGKLAIVRVDSSATTLLQPVIERCNPGTAADVSEYDGNPAAVQRSWDEGFDAPLQRAFSGIQNASGAQRSPILESVQSVALTQFQRPGAEGATRRLVIASDLLQNTERLSFYGALPSADNVVAGEGFRLSRTNLNNVEVELWMLQRPDSAQTQPRALPDLWDRLISEQGGRVTRVYRVSG